MYLYLSMVDIHLWVLFNYGRSQFKGVSQPSIWIKMVQKYNKKLPKCDIFYCLSWPQNVSDHISSKIVLENFMGGMFPYPPETLCPLNN